MIEPKSKVVRVLIDRTIRKLIGEGYSLEEVGQVVNLHRLGVIRHLSKNICEDINDTDIHRIR